MGDSNFTVRPPRDLREPKIDKSVEHSHGADAVLLWGVASVLLGWTFFVPIAGLVCFVGLRSQCQKDHVPTPGRALVGAILAILFGTAHAALVLKIIAVHDHWFEG